VSTPDDVISLRRFRGYNEPVQVLTYPELPEGREYEELVPPRPQKFPSAKQRRLNQLLEKNSEGIITPKETATLKQLVREAEELMVANARRLAAFSKGDAVHPSRGVPVTVWIQPHSQPAEP
jgi:5-methylcytosine-specific restriction endonuclease McrA